jgi:hypothetical protein
MNPEYYRAEAARRLRLAEGVSDPEVEAKLRTLAREYFELAEELERASLKEPPPL